MCSEWPGKETTFSKFRETWGCILEALMKISICFYLSFYAPEIEDRGAYCFCPVCHSVIPSFCHSLWNFNLAYNFSTVNFTWVLLVIRPFRGYHYFLPCDLDLVVWPIFLKTLTLLITFEQWVLELWYFTWVFLVMRPFSGYHFFLPCDLDLWVWPSFFKTLTLLITFEQ